MNDEGKQLVQKLTQMSKQFTTNDVSEIIPINFHEDTTQGIENMLNKYYSFLGQKQSKLQQMQRYLNRLIQNVKIAKKYFDMYKEEANQIIQKCPNYSRILTQKPKIKIKTSPKLQAFFKNKDLVE